MRVRQRGLHLGFSGGWKSIAVGLSTWRSIRHTHHPDGMSMSVLNNRMHDVLNEMGAHLEASLGKRIYKIECVLASPTKIAHVWAGGVTETRAAALEVMASRNPPRRSQAEPADVVVYGLPAWSPYAIFGQMNPILTLISSGLGYLGGYIEALGKPGCTVVLATPCPETWDMEHHPSYARRGTACCRRRATRTRSCGASRTSSPRTPATSSATATASPSTRCTPSWRRTRCGG